jgi:hypothetical protein
MDEIQPADIVGQVLGHMVEEENEGDEKVGLSTTKGYKKHRTENSKKSQRAEDGKRAELATFLIYKKLWDRWRARKPRRKGLRLGDAAIHRKKEKHKKPLKRKKGKTTKGRKKRVYRNQERGNISDSLLNHINMTGNYIN